MCKTKQKKQHPDNSFSFSLSLVKIGIEKKQLPQHWQTQNEHIFPGWLIIFLFQLCTSILLNVTVYPKTKLLLSSSWHGLRCLLFTHHYRKKKYCSLYKCDVYRVYGFFLPQNCSLIFTFKVDTDAEAKWAGRSQWKLEADCTANPTRSTECCVLRCKSVIDQCLF